MAALVALSALAPGAARAESAAEADVVVVVDTSTSMREPGMDPERTSLLVTKLLADISPGSLAVVRLLDLQADSNLLPSRRTGESLPCSEDPSQTCERVEEATDWWGEALTRTFGALSRPARADSGYKKELEEHLVQKSNNSLFDLALRSAQGVLDERRRARSSGESLPQTVIWLSDGRSDNEPRVGSAVSELTQQHVAVEAIVFGRGDTRLPSSLGLKTHQVKSPAALMKAFAGSFRRIVQAPYELDAVLASAPSFEIKREVDEAWIVVYGDDSLSRAELSGPGGVVVADHAAERWAGAGAYRVAYLRRPAAGRWTIQATGGGAGSAYAVVQRSSLSPVFLGPAQALSGAPTTLLAAIHGGSSAEPIRDREILAEARLSVLVQGSTILLHDDGREGDSVAGDGQFSGSFTFRGFGSETLRLRLKTPLVDREVEAVVRVGEELGFWARWGWLVLLVLAVLVLLFVIAGYILPDRFQPSLAVVFVPEREELDEQSPQPVRQWRGVGVGFYRHARAYLHPDFRLSGNPRGALAALVATKGGTRVFPSKGMSLHREALDGSFEPVAPEGRAAHQGDVYRVGERGPFFRLTSRRGRA